MTQIINNVPQTIIQEQEEKVKNIKIQLEYETIHLKLLKTEFSSTYNHSPLVSKESTLQILSDNTSGKGMFLKDIIKEYLKLGVITDFRTLYYTIIQKLVEDEVIKVIKLKTTRVRKYKLNNQQH